jgi:hypothetical protein
MAANCRNQVSISIVESDLLAQTLEMAAKATKGTTLAKGVGLFLVLGDSRNFIDSHDAGRVAEVLRKLKGSDPDIQYIPLENTLLGIATPFIVIVHAHCGIRAFEVGKRTVLAVFLLEQKLLSEQRVLFHEQKLLFPATFFIWADRIDDEQFELLVLELLNVEPGVLRARRTGRSRNVDDGSDFIIDWRTAPFVGEVGNPSGQFVNRRVVGQCKAFTASVGKASAPDIRGHGRAPRRNGLFSSSFINNYKCFGKPS